MYADYTEIFSGGKHQYSGFGFIQEKRRGEFHYTKLTAPFQFSILTIEV